jgi:hypothetical protein
MSDRKKQEIRGLRSIYTVNMAGYKLTPLKSSESSEIFKMLSFFLGGGAYFYFCSGMSNIKYAVSERIKDSKFADDILKLYTLSSFNV